MKTIAMIFLTTVMALPPQVEATLWYVDKGAVGVNNGTSWQNAWISFEAIKWPSIVAGDTLFISGGPSGSSKTYSSPLLVGSSGTPTAPIAIKLDANNDAHNGTVTLAGTWIDVSNISNVKFSGNVNGERHLVIRDSFNITNNEYAWGMLAAGSINVKVEFLTWFNVNNGIKFTDSTGFHVNNCIFEQMRGDAVIRASGSFGSAWDSNIIENSKIEVVVNNTDGGGPDGIQNGNNITIRNNTFTVRRVPFYTSNQHPDMVQAPGAYLAIYNNDFINVGDSCIQLHGWYAGSTHSHVHIFNNIFRIVEAIDPYPEYIRLYNVGYPIADISDLKIVHNLFMDNNWVNITTDIKSLGGNPTGSGNMIANNIWYNAGAGGAWNLEWSSNWAADAWKFDGNIYYPGDSAVIKFKGISYSGTAWVAAQEQHGSVAKPLFVNYIKNNLNNDLHLLSPGPIGMDLDTLSAQLPKIFFDKDGRPRPPWYVGPYQVGSDNPNGPNAPNNLRLN